MEDEFVDPDVIQDRYQRLVDLQTSIGLEINEALVGESVEVLVEGPSKTDAAMRSGRTRTNKLVHFPGAAEAGTMAQVRLTRAAPHFLIGEPA